MTKKRKTTSDAIEILHRRYYKGKPERVSELEEARVEDELARIIPGNPSRHKPQRRENGSQMTLGSGIVSP